jgi:hypothetical protein
MTLTRQRKLTQLTIISLLVELTALAYNTWRNEPTEAHMRADVLLSARDK